MRIEQLLYLITIAETGSYSNASKELHIAQPSLSHAIHQLEEELDIRLLERNYSGAVLTPLGRVIVSHAKNILEEVGNIQRVARTANTQNTPLKIVAGIVPISTFLPKAMERLSSSDREHEISIREGSSQLAESLLERGEIDFAVVPYIDPPKNSALFRYTPLLNTCLIAIVPKTCPLSQKTVLSFEDIQPYPITIGDEENISSSYILQRIHQYGEPKIAIRMKNIALAIPYIRTSNIVGMSFDLSCIEHLKNVDNELILLPIHPPLIMTFGILSKKGRYLPPLAQTLINNLKETSSEYQNMLNSFSKRQ